MRVTGSRRLGEDGYRNQPLVFVGFAAVFLAGFLPALAKARAHGHGAFASISLGMLGGLLGLALFEGVSLSFIGLAKWSETRKRRKELDKERRG